MFKGCQWLQTTPNTNGVDSKKKHITANEKYYMYWNKQDYSCK